MIALRFFALSLLVVVGFASAPEAHAWGDKGHRIIAFVGAELTPGIARDFWSVNAEGVESLANLPDNAWKNPSTKKAEAPTHWFQADAYVPDLKQCNELLQFPKSHSVAVKKYGEQMVARNGSASWRVVQMYDLALQSLKSGFDRSTIEYASVMSHYVGDLSMPLHVSSNYDGQKTGNGGIHAHFEISVIDDEDAIRERVRARAQQLLKDKAFLKDFEGDLADTLQHEVIRSLLARDLVLQNDTQYGRNGKRGRETQLALAVDRMADGAATLSLILARLTKESGKKSTGTSAPVETTELPWIAPDYED